MMRAEKRKLADFGELSEAEAKILADLDSPHMTVLGNDVPSADAGPDRRARASFIRWCALGGDDAHRLHESGVQIKCALIVSDGDEDPEYRRETAGLNLQGANVPGDLILGFCRFEDPLVLRGARMQTLNLHGSALPGIMADRLETKGSIFLRLAKVTGGALFRSVKVGGDFECRGGQFVNEGGKALVASGATIAGVWFWMEGASARGEIDFTGLKLGAINDDSACWPEERNLLLDRCYYGAFTGWGVSGEARLKWLGLQDPGRFGKDFWPQPWEQCAAVLREMGHSADARAVMVDKERRQRADRCQQLRVRLEAARLRQRLAAIREHKRSGLVAWINKRLSALKTTSRRDANMLRRSVLRSPYLELCDLNEEEGEVVHLQNVTPQPAKIVLGVADITKRAVEWRSKAFWDGTLGTLIDYGQRPLKAVIG
jgi:hypothetical protein